MAIQSSELYAAVTQYIEDETTPDALERRTAFFSHLMGKGKKQQKGGLYIQVPIKLLANASSGFISGTSAVTSGNPSIQLQYMTFNRYYYNYNVNFTLQDEDVATGPEEKINFMQTKIEGAMNDFVREVSTQIHSTQSGYSCNGLLDVVATTGTAYGGLTDSNYDSGTFLGIYDTTSAIPNYATISPLYVQLQARIQKELPSNRLMGLTNAYVYGKFLTSCQAQQVFSNSTLLAAGSEAFHVNNMDVILDADSYGTQGSANNYFYIFPTEIMKLYYHFGFGTKSRFDGEKELPLQPILSLQHYMSFNFVCTNRRLVAVAKALNA